MQTRLWIVRHGQSAGNVARDEAEASGAELIELATRDADVPLSDLGCAQAHALARELALLPKGERPERLLTSPFVRSMQTCGAIADALAIDRTCGHVDERLRLLARELLAELAPIHNAVGARGGGRTHRSARARRATP